MVGGWFNKTVVLSSNDSRYAFDYLAPDGSGKGGVKICPDVPDAIKGTGAGYSLYVGTKAFNESFCIEAVGLNLMPKNVTFGAWEYV